MTISKLFHQSLEKMEKKKCKGSCGPDDSGKFCSCENVGGMCLCMGVCKEVGGENGEVVVNCMDE